MKIHTAKPKLRILELCHFSAGICGVWNRVFEESKRLSQLGHEVRIFSSNAVKGSSKAAAAEEKIDGVRINRFSFKKLGGESFMYWNFLKEAINYSPDIIIAHSYRHPHTIQALKVAERLKSTGKKSKVFLVTHAPFERQATRSFVENLIVDFYDYFIGKKTLNKFDRVIAITKWEIPHLIKLGVDKKRIEYIPNGIPSAFFSKTHSGKKNNILFLGRISPIKNLELPLKALKILKRKELEFHIVGPAEVDYRERLVHLINSFKLGKRVFFHAPVYNIPEKIKKIDSCFVFILPSKSEGMPQSLIEAMARAKIVVASDTPAAKDIIINSKNGYLFKKDDAESLALILEKILSGKYRDTGSAARESVRQFEWNRIIQKLEGLF
jgi:glycosyltransferase involved in cell wall biosynthesis